MLQEKSRERALWMSFLPAIVPKTDWALNFTDFLFASEMPSFVLIRMSGTTVVWHSKACLKTSEEKKWSDLMMIRNETKQGAWWKSKMTALNSNWQVVKRDWMGLCAMGMVPNKELAKGGHSGFSDIRNSHRAATSSLTHQSVQKLEVHGSVQENH